MDSIQKSHFVSDNCKGRTIIEVLIAMAIFTIGFLAVGTMVLSTTHNNTAGNLITEGTMLAREKIEFLKTLPVDQMKAQCSGEPEAERLNGIFERSCDVQASYSDKAKIVEVTVAWRRRGQTREVVLRTLTRGKGM